MAEPEPTPTAQPLHGDGLREAMRARLAGLPRESASDPALSHAAVVTLVVPLADGTAGFLLTRRAGHLRQHRGQWALPGGRLDRGETITEAALRELHEEVGVDLPPAQVLGLLDDYTTRSGYCITPVVAWADDLSTLQANPDEVEAVYQVPLHDICAPQAATMRRDRDDEHSSFCLRMQTLGTRIHAPTAAILHQFAEVCVHGRATRVNHLDQPRFAWR